MQFNWPEFAASIITAAKLNVLYIIRPLSVETVDYAFQAEFVLKPVAVYVHENSFKAVCQQDVFALLVSSC
jgi:hypothetical protein